jgi:ketosteroid isomerase-like protein
MSGEVQTVRAAFDAFDRRDPEALARLFDPDAELVTAVPPRRVARDRRYEGHGGMRRFLAEIEDDWAFYRVTLLEARRLTPGTVVAEGTVVVSGPEGGFGTFAAWVFAVEAGRISRVEPFLTRDALRDRLRAGYPRDTPKDDQVST